MAKKSANPYKEQVFLNDLHEAIARVNCLMQDARNVHGHLDVQIGLDENANGVFLECNVWKRVMTTSGDEL